MDTSTRIKRLVESSLKSSFGDELFINEVIVLPTQKYDEEVKEWVPDSHTLFLSLKTIDHNNYESQGNFAQSRKVTAFLESLLGIECCVDFV